MVDTFAVVVSALVGMAVFFGSTFCVAHLRLSSANVVRAAPPTVALLAALASYRLARLVMTGYRNLSDHLHRAARPPLEWSEETGGRVARPGAPRRARRPGGELR